MEKMLAGGSGITYVVAQELYNAGIDGITLEIMHGLKEIVNFIS